MLLYFSRAKYIGLLYAGFYRESAGCKASSEDNGEEPEAARGTGQSVGHGLRPAIQDGGAKPNDGEPKPMLLLQMKPLAYLHCRPVIAVCMKLKLVPPHCKLV